jgi:phosphonatase-like hydrolase
MNGIELVVFDIAGTTVRDNGNVAKAFISAFESFGYTIKKEDAQEVMGFRKKDAIRILLNKLYPDIQENKDELIEKIHAVFTTKMISFYQNDADLQPLPYAEDVFIWLRKKGVKLALNTGFTKAITDTMLQRLEWTSGATVDYVISSDEVPMGRPSPDMIQAIMKKLNIINPSSVAKVGDTEVDVEEGRHAGCGLVVSVTTGAYSRKRLEEYRPDHIIDSLSELPTIIESIA